MSSGNHWQDYHRRWSALRPPLRPTHETVEILKALVGDRDARVLLLGVTQELAHAFPRLLATDKNRAMIDNLWPGDSAERGAIEADWLALDDSVGRFSAVIGDGSCNAVTYPAALATLLQRVSERLERRGKFVCRLYERPERVWPEAELVAMGEGPAALNFHAFKWQLAMRIAEDSEPTVPVAAILERFDRLFPDRARLAAATGWAREVIDTIDAYRGSAIAYCFPSRRELLALMPRALGRIGFHSSGSYDLAECCPMLSCERVSA
jgi:hypothetical protein